MIRVILYLAAILAIAWGLSWLADNPGTVSIEWPAVNLKAEPSLFQVVIGLALLVGTALFGWSLFRQLWNGPAAVGNLLNRRRQERGLEALSSGMIAIGAGDRATATKYAIQARKSLPNEPLTHLLRAQAAQLSGDKATSRRIFEAMLASPDTEQLGLRGLFLEAQREKEPEAARQFAERALGLNQKLAWASDALFEIQCKAGDLDGALDTLAIARRYNHVDKALADRRRAVLLAGIAMKSEDAEPARALQLATEAHALAPDLVPAANIAGRMLASRGNTGKAAKILLKTWERSPHPDLATAYAFARIGDSPRDRLDRVKQLAASNPHSIESAIAVANAAIDAKAFDEAREALEPMTDGRLTQRVATLMARIESEQHGDKGRVREWLARAVNASRDAVWTADGVISEQWAPVSPVTGQLDAFQWRVPVEMVGGSNTELIARRHEELVALGAPAAVVASTETSAGPAPAAKSGADRPAVARRAVPVDAVVVEDMNSKPVAPKAGPDAAKAPVEPDPKPAATPPAASPEAASVPTAPPAATTQPPTGAMPSNTGAVAARPASSAPPSVHDAAPKPVTAQPASAAARAKKLSDPAPAATAKEPRIFVVPHAPDDPGPDASEPDAVKGIRPPYRAVP
jgi:HemY protein